MGMKRKGVFAICLAVAGVAATVSGAAFTPGDVVVFEAGNDAGALGSNTAYACSLLEFNPTAVNQSGPVQTIPLPAYDSGTQHALTSVGAAADNLMSLSADGRYLSVIGCDVPAGSEYLDPVYGPQPAVDCPDRTIARIDGSGNVDTSTSGPFGVPGSSTRGATTANGTGFWFTTATGTIGNIGYVPFGGSSANVLVSNYGARVLGIYAGQLYAVSSTTATAGVASVGTGLPTSGTQPVTSLPNTNDPTKNLNASGFFMATVKPGDTAPDVMYVCNANDTGEINKYSYNGSTWVLTGQIEDGDATDLTGVVNNGVVTLFATSNANSVATLSTLIDSNGWNASISSTHLSTLYSVSNDGDKIAFRGVAMAPVVSTITQSGVWSSSAGGNWSSIGNWTGGVPNAVDASASFGSVTAGAQEIAVDIPVTLGALTFDSNSSYTIAGSNTLSLSASSGPAVITVTEGSHSIAVPIMATAGLNVITEDTGALPSLTLPIRTTVIGTLNKSGPGTLAFAGSASGIGMIVLQSLSVNAGTVMLDSGTAAGARTLLQVGSLNVSSGKLDLGSNDLVVTGESLLTINSLIQGGAIYSSAVASDSAHLTALGVIQNSVDGNPASAALYGSGMPLGLFDGTSPADSAVLVRYTYLGDTNLDGVIDGSDYSRIDAGYEQGLTGWYNGDFNYDNVVDGSDYTLMDNAFNQQGGDALAATITSQLGGISNVPEPATPIVCASVIGLLRRRKRSS
jgi:hypothetical protein